AIDALEEAEEQPEPEPEPEVDTAELEALIEEAEGYAGEGYTEDSFAVLTEALEAAEAVVADEDATQDEVEEALSSLQNASDALEEAEEQPEPEPEPEVDTAELEALIEEAEGYVGEDYTEDSFAVLAEALEAAEAVVADEDATQDEVEEALSSLQN